VTINNFDERQISMIQGDAPPATLQHALRALRGIRQRYEMERTAHPNGRSFTVHVTLVDSDMFWISATIEALEKPIAAAETPAELAGDLQLAESVAA
jgi:hypothetical protein